jgi:hypothetical protein
MGAGAMGMGSMGMGPIGAGPAGNPAAGLADLARFVADGIIGPISDGIRQAAQNLSDNLAASAGAAAPGTGAPGVSARGGFRPHGRKDDPCCEPCGPCEDPCHCRCCIVDADLVIYARLGERRVVPLTIENRWRRERNIKLDLSGWSTRGGSTAAVKATLLPPAPAFTLAPCSTQAIIMVVESDINANRQESGRLVDVDDCTVYYADLRVEGCEIRPVRIALALLPRDCGAYEIECRCGCCC